MSRIIAAGVVRHNPPVRLAPGTRLGPYEITAPLGAGGMGEVYRARDANLRRDVAIKVLLASVADDPDRLARFTREAQLLASLNHPHIAQIYGVEEAGGIRAIVMELVEGPTLAERIARGPIAVDEALPIAKQIAEALEAAHETGVVHRDLKPANIKVRPDGAVKVLDLGLAKALETSGVASADATISPTTMSQHTRAGIVLGTAAYMAPEQARGRMVDRRADVWAFGCVLYEMLTGVRAFRGEDVTDTMVAVLSQEPDWSLLPTEAAPLRPLLARCLRKDPKQRVQAIGDVRIQLDELPAHGFDQETALDERRAVTPPSRGRLTVAVAGLAVGAVIAALATRLMSGPEPPAPAVPARFEIVPPAAHPLALFPTYRNVAISPDGRHVAYRGGQGQLIVRGIDSLDARPLEGIAGAEAPFFSPDSQWIGFFDGAGLKRVAITGGPAITIVSGYMVPRGASWGDDGRIVFGTYDTGTGLLRVPASGGEPEVLTRPDEEDGRDHWYPSLLPAGRGVLLTLNRPGTDPREAQVAALDLETGQVRPLMRGGHPEYVDTGHLLYATADTLFAVRFDPTRLEVLSDPVPLVEGVSTGLSGAADFAVSRHGTLVYVPVGAQRGPRSLVWIDRQGRETPTGAPMRNYRSLRLSPDGTRVALTIQDQQSDIYLWNLARETLAPLTSGPGDKRVPVWTADGRRIVFATGDGLMAQAADGTGAPVRVAKGLDQAPAYVAPDGTGILGDEFSPQTSGDIIWFPLAGPSAGPGPTPGASPATANRLVATTFSERYPDVSPNGRYMAYQSNESGQNEIYVRPFPRVEDGGWRVTTRGGTHPQWQRNGRELFYRDPADMLMSVPVEIAGSTFTSGNPVALFELSYLLPGRPRDYDVAPDGKRFLVLKPQAADSRPQAPATLVVVLHWFEELKARVSGAR
jgi:serine/threonine-protein kinase